MTENTGANHLRVVLTLIIITPVSQRLLFEGVRGRGAEPSKDAITEAVLHSRSADSAAG